MSSSSGPGSNGIENEVFNAGIRLPFDGNLHEFQIEDLNKFGRRKKCGYFYDIGMGKTVTGALTAGYHLLNGFDRAMVICPASLIVQWTEALKKMNFDAVAYRGAPEERKRIGFDHDFMVMSFEIFIRDYNRIRDLKSVYFVIDEATILSNSQNKFHKMFNGGVVKKSVKVQGRAKPMIVPEAYNNINEGCCLLTATPSNNPSDLYGLIKTMEPSIYTNKFQFDRIHVASTDFFGAPSEFQNLDLLRSNLEGIASIRFATDELDMPEKVYNVIEYDLDPEHMKLYKNLLEERLIVYKDRIVIDAIQIMSLHNWAQKIIVNPDKAMYRKDPAGLALLDTIVRNNPQTLIVNKYTMSNTKLMERYKDIGVGGCYGLISRSKQDKYIKDFQAKKLRVLTVHAKSGGIGLNLQCCSNVVFNELPMTARDMKQAEGRVYRQGQQNRVIVTLLIARGTIQATLLNKIMAKDEINSEVLRSPTTLRQELFP
jgi:SNF2 family DNA or RNA helicase